MHMYRARLCLEPKLHVDVAADALETLPLELEPRVLHELSAHTAPARALGPAVRVARAHGR